MTGRKGKRIEGVRVMLDCVASTMCHYPDVENRKLVRVVTWTRLPRRSHIFGMSSAGSEYQQSSCQGGHDKPHNSDSKVEFTLYDV